MQLKLNLKPMQTEKCKCSTFSSQSRILKIVRQYDSNAVFYANRTHTKKDRAKSKKKTVTQINGALQLNLYFIATHKLDLCTHLQKGLLSLACRTLSVLALVQQLVCFTKTLSLIILLSCNVFTLSTKTFI